MKFVFFFIFLLILFTWNVHGENVTITLERDSYASGETLQARIYFSMLLEDEITVRDITLLDSKGKSISIAPVLLEINANESYIYFDIPNLASGNYSLVLEGVTYLKEGILVKEDFSVTFPIINKDVILSLFPAALIIENDFSDTSFTLRVYARKGDASVGVSSSDFILVRPIGFTLNEGQFRDIEIFVSGGTGEGGITLNYGEETYFVPAFLPNLDSSFVVNSNSTYELVFLDITTINKTLEVGKSISGAIEIANIGSGNLSDLTFILDDSLAPVVRMNLSNISYLNTGEVFGQYLWINENAKVGSYFGNLTLHNDLFTLTLPIYLLVVNSKMDDEPLPVEEPLSNTSLDNTDRNFTDLPPEEEGSRWWLWIIFIVATLLIVLSAYLFYLKKRKPTEFNDFLEGLKGR